MSLLADFDWVLEMSRGGVEQLVQLGFRPTQEDPPFEIDLSVARLILYPPTIELEAGTANVNLTLPFEEMSLSFGLAGLNGKLRVRAAFRIVDGTEPGPPLRFLTVNLSAATVWVEFDQDSKNEISVIPGFQQIADNMVTHYVHGLEAPRLPADGFAVDPSRDGSLTPLRFVRLDTVTCIDANTVGLFGNLLVERREAGNISQKTVLATLPGEAVSVSVSEAAFRRLVFGPALAIQFRSRELEGTLGPDAAAAAASAEIDANPELVTATLPPDCGTAHERVLEGGIRLKRVTCEFSVGHMDLLYLVHQSGDCYEADITLTQQMTLQFVVNSALRTTLRTTFTPNPPNHSIDVDTDFLCDALPFVLGGLAGMMTGIFPVAVGIAIAGTIFKNDLVAQGKAGANIPSSQAGDQPMTGFDGVSFKNPVRIVPEAVTFGGVMFHPYIPPLRKPTVEITAGVAQESPARLVSSGIFHYEGRKLCLPGDFAYEEYEHSQVAYLTAKPVLVGRPLVWEWWIECWRGFYLGNSEPQRIGQAQLTELNGAVLVNVDTRYPLPLPDGTVVENYSATIPYTRLSDDQVVLRNFPQDGNYSISVVAKVASAHRNADGSVGVFLEGNTVEFGDDYRRHMLMCAIRRVKEEARPAAVDLDPWDAIRNPPPDPRVLPIADMIRQTMLAKPTELSSFVSQLRLENGNAVVEAALHQALDIRTK